MMRSITGCCFLGPLLFLPSILPAQTSVYAHVGLANYGFSNIDGTGGLTAKRDTVGVGGGVFYNFPIQSRVTAGVDGRFEASPGYDGGVLGGAALRIGFVPHQVRFRPYFQIGAGVVHSGYNDSVYEPVPGGYTPTPVHITKTCGAAQFLVGLDVRLTDRFDLRLPELGAQAGSGSGVSAESAFLNIGLVFHVKPLVR